MQTILQNLTEGKLVKEDFEVKNQFITNGFFVMIFRKNQNKIVSNSELVTSVHYAFQVS